MNLGEILNRIEEFSDEAVVYASKTAAGRWTIDSSAEVVQAEDQEDDLKAPAGMDYLLEVQNIQDVLDRLNQTTENETPSAAEKLEAVVFYAIHDTFLR